MFRDRLRNANRGNFTIASALFFLTSRFFLRWNSAKNIKGQWVNDVGRGYNGCVIALKRISQSVGCMSARSDFGYRLSRCKTRAWKASSCRPRYDRRRGFWRPAKIDKLEGNGGGNRRTDIKSLRGFHAEITVEYRDWTVIFRGSKTSIFFRNQEVSNWL